MPGCPKPWGIRGGLEFPRARLYLISHKWMESIILLADVEAFAPVFFTSTPPIFFRRIKEQIVMSFLPSPRQLYIVHKHRRFFSFVGRSLGFLVVAISIMMFPLSLLNETSHAKSSAEVCCGIEKRGGLSETPAIKA